MQVVKWLLKQSEKFESKQNLKVIMPTLHSKLEKSKSDSVKLNFIGLLAK